MTPYEELENYGVADAGTPLDVKQTIALQRACETILLRSRGSFAEYLKGARNDTRYMAGRVVGNADWTIAVDALGVERSLDDAVERIVGDTNVKALLESVLGPGYQLASLNIRRAEPGSGGQDLHQDASDELGMSILVSDVAHSGATAFIRRSHRWPIRYSDFGVPMRIRRLAPVCAAASGAPGRVGFFFHRTWHGRHPSPDRPATALLAHFKAVGGEFTPHRPPAEVLERLGPELRTILDCSRGLKMVSSTRAVVTWTGDGLFPGRPAWVEEIFQERLPLPSASAWRLVKAWARAKDYARHSRAAPILRRIVGAAEP